MNVVQETSKQVGSFFSIMREQPLALALVVMNFLLMGFLFYASISWTTSRRETTQMIIAWQERTDQLMASCVSADIMAMILKALERDRNGNGGRKPIPPAEPKQP